MVLQEKWLVFGGDFKPFSASGYNGLWSVQIENYESGKHIKKTLINRWVKKVYSWENGLIRKLITRLIVRVKGGSLRKVSTT